MKNLNIFLFLLLPLNIFSQTFETRTHRADFMFDIKKEMCSDSTVKTLSNQFWSNSCNFFIKFDNHSVDIDSDGDSDLIVNLYETKFGQHGIGILENVNGELKLGEMFHLNGDGGALLVGDFDGNGYLDIHSTPVNYHGEGRFDGFLPDFYNGHIVHPNLFVFRDENGFDIDTLISSDPSKTSNYDFVMQGFTQTVFDVDDNGKDDLISAHGKHSFIYKWNDESNEMFPVDTMSTNGESFISDINVFDSNNDGFVDLIYTINNKNSWNYEFWIFYGDNGEFKLDNPSLVLEGFNDSKNYDNLESRVLDINNDGQIEIIQLIGKNIDDESYFSSKLLIYSLGDTFQDMTTNYFPNNFNTSWVSIGNGFDIVDVNGDGFKDILFDDTHVYNDGMLSDLIINKGNGFEFINVDDRRSGITHLDLEGDGVSEILYFESFCFKTLQTQTSTSIETEINNSFTLNQNYPNPFNSSTIISFELESSDNVELSLFDINGRKVKIITNTFLYEGEHSIQLDMNGLPSGVYFYTLKNSQNILTKSLTLIK